MKICSFAHYYGQRPLSRSGTILIVVAGLSSLLAMMTLVFLTRMRNDAEETQRLTADIQGRIMRAAALQYIQETARLGWYEPPHDVDGDPTPDQANETFGWIDVRDGRPGPRTENGDWPRKRLTSAGSTPGYLFIITDAVLGTGPFFPACGGKAARCPMYAMKIPPFAVQAVAAPNALHASTLDDAAWTTLVAKPWKDIIAYTHLDPQPQLATVATGSTRWDTFRSGDTSPRLSITGSWFRVFRKVPIPVVSGAGPPWRVPPSVFVITTGYGGTLGFKDWNEVQSNVMTDVFGSRDVFESLRAQESLRWYEVEWSPAVGGSQYFHYSAKEGYSQNELGSPNIGVELDSTNSRSFGGTYSYIERLMDEPATW